MDVLKELSLIGIVPVIAIQDAGGRRAAGSGPG